MTGLGRARSNGMRHMPTARLHHRTIAPSHPRTLAPSPAHISMRMHAVQTCARSQLDHNCIGNNYLGHDYTGHNYIGHNYLCADMCAKQARPQSH